MVPKLLPFYHATHESDPILLTTQPVAVCPIARVLNHIRVNVGEIVFLCKCMRVSKCVCLGFKMVCVSV